jgi:hypothetical protein
LIKDLEKSHSSQPQIIERQKALLKRQEALLKRAKAALTKP